MFHKSRNLKPCFVDSFIPVTTYCCCFDRIFSSPIIP